MQVDIDQKGNTHRARWKCPKCSRRVTATAQTFLALVLRLKLERERRCLECMGRASQGRLL
jgi:transcriptional regulator NrdR family protein